MISELGLIEIKSNKKEREFEVLEFKNVKTNGL